MSYANEISFLSIVWCRCSGGKRFFSNLNSSFRSSCMLKDSNVVKASVTAGVMSTWKISLQYLTRWKKHKKTEIPWGYISVWGCWVGCNLHFFSWLVSWCFKSSQPWRITSGLREAFIKRYVVERTSTAEIRPEEQGEKWRVVGRIYGMKYSWKGHKHRNRHKNRIKRSGQAQLIYVWEINHNIPTMRRWAYRDA